MLAIAASTGGPAALHQLLSGLPANYGLPILVVQHIALGFAQGLAEWLSTASGHPVVVARDGERPREGHVYIPPDDRHLGLHPERTLQVSNAAPVGGFRPSGTFLFRSMAHVLGSQTLTLVLTGMGQDGVDGLRSVRQAGGRVLAQDEASSIVWGMPGAAHAAGLVDELVPLGRLAARIEELTS
jgi:two-component system, chemotaxis family, protein-glutamate methylesterase/glutaminase